jgi:hypothetical protein
MWTETIGRLSELLPHGSGIDGENKVDLEKSHAEKLVIHTEYHHMKESGFYDGWTEHTVTVTPSFSGINLRISGQNRNDIKDYLSETFDYALIQDVTYHVLLQRFPQFAIKHSWEFSCPWCEAQWADSNTRHTCDSFPGDRSSPNRYQAKNEKQVFSAADQSFNSLAEAQNYAADLMERELAKIG